ncbi:Bgt-50651 [Blumeria graminis f. sp. tritici]|uniref:Bgt-50651 n=1 Tax=Blumeria graminis f. sp. tritici TaxID=62690 RepID=A0A9X9LB38_BLUGR|nr:Bgt-50651 [Blumeria graminis f. sp. tritici]
MRSANLASLSLLFGFLILESAADYVCSGGTRIPDHEVETRANEIYSKGLSLKASRTPGQQQIEDIYFDDDEDDAEMSFSSDFYPRIKSSGTYTITVDYPSKNILVIEKIEYNGRYQMSSCIKR